jgi:hypothetical protein
VRGHAGQEGHEMTVNETLGATSRTHRRTRTVESFRSAADTIGPLEKDMSLFGVTRGQFSMIDIISHCVRQVGLCDLSMWTWTIADYELEAFEYFFTSSAIKSARLVIDRSAENRNHVIIQRWRDRFGAHNVRVCKNHAKLARISNENWRILARGSMNLNFNPRFEQFDITEGGEDFNLVERIENELPILPPRCSNHEAESASQLMLAFDVGVLNKFEGYKPWVK